MMDCYEFADKSLTTTNRLSARIASQAADIREYMTRNDIAVNLMMRGMTDPELILLVLGHEEEADTLVATRIKADNIDEIIGQNYMDWEKFVALKLLSKRAAAQAPATGEDETADDLPFPADESEVEEDET